MLSAPTVTEREAQPYVAIRKKVSMQEISTLLPPLIPELIGWLGAHQVVPWGAPFFRYLRMEPNDMLDVEVGIPVSAPVLGDERVHPGAIPKGRYLTVTYTGSYAGLRSAHMALEAEAARRGAQWTESTDESGPGIGFRAEIYITDPTREPNPEKWQTEIISLLAEDAKE